MFTLQTLQPSTDSCLRFVNSKSVQKGALQAEVSLPHRVFRECTSSVALTTKHTTLAQASIFEFLQHTHKEYIYILSVIRVQVRYGDVVSTDS